jgi:hypothetical protein
LVVIVGAALLIAFTAALLADLLGAALTPTAHRRHARADTINARPAIWKKPVMSPEPDASIAEPTQHRTVENFVR